MMLGDAMTPFDPVLGDAMTLFYPILVVFLSKLNSKLPSVFFEITSVEVPVFKITLLYRKMLMTLTKGVNFTNILHANFSHEIVLCTYYSLCNFFGPRKLAQKLCVKCW